MINLYQMLNLPPDATEAEIRDLVAQHGNEWNPKTLKAVEEWLLVAEVRVRYDAKLRQMQPEFFAEHDLPAPTETFTETPTPRAAKPKIVPKNAETENDDDYMDLPPLWNPKVAFYWSLFFNAIFGALIHAKNWEILGEPELAKQNYYFALAVLVGLTLGAMLLPEMPLGVSLGLSVAWYFSLGKKQVAFFESEFDNDYERKKWVLPVFLGLVGAGLWLFIIMFLMEILGIE